MDILEYDDTAADATLAHGISPAAPPPHLGHGGFVEAVHQIDPTAYLIRATAGAIWEVRSYDGEVYGIGGPQPEKAWEAAAHYLGTEVSL